MQMTIPSLLCGLLLTFHLLILKKRERILTFAERFLLPYKTEKQILKTFFIFGELGLDGEVKETSSLFALILSLTQTGELTKAIVPTCSLDKLSCIPNAEFYGVNNLRECIDFFTSDEIRIPASVSSFEYPFILSGREKLFLSKELSP